MEDAPAEAEPLCVYARLRPPAGAARGEVQVRRRFGQAKAIQVRNMEFALDWVFDEETTQEELYEMAASERIDWVLSGFSATLIAYGQTGSGKTHSMIGPESVMETGSLDVADPDELGLIPRACQHLFDELHNREAQTSIVVQCGYVEVYNDRLNDLLGDGRNLKLRERKRGLAVDGLTFELTPTADDVMSALWRGNAQRTVAAMKMNGRSSRGHAILYLCIDEFNGDDGKRMGKLTLVDLAGMESSKKSFAVDGPSNDPRQREEAKHINTSLCALASVVAALSSGGAGAGGAHVPYRDSKLTRLLQDSLADGCSKTAVFVTLRTEPENIEETIATLRFAQRAKAVQVHVRPNAVESEMDPRRLLAQLAHSDLELAAARGIITNLEQALSRAEAQVRDQLTLSRGAEAVGGSPLGGWAAAGFGIGGPGGTDQSQGAGGAVRGGVGAGTGVAGRTVDEQHLASLELEVRFLRGKNRQLRARTVMQRFMHVQAQQKSAAAIKEQDELRLRCDELEEALEDRSHKISLLQAECGKLRLGATASASRAGGGPGPGEVPQGSADPAQSAKWVGVPSLAASAGASLAEVSQRRPLAAGRLGEMSASRRSNRRLNLPTPTGEGSDQFARFSNVAMTRKLLLAARGFEVENVFIDQLYDDAKSQGIGEDEWHDFVLAEMPSPTREQTSDGQAPGDSPDFASAMNVTISNPQRKAREDQGAPAAVLTRVKSWWVRSESNPAIDTDAAGDEPADKARRACRPAGPACGVAGSSAALSRGPGIDPAMGIGANAPPYRHRCRQDGAAGISGHGLFPPARAFLAPVGASEASAQARYGAVRSAAHAAAEAAAAAALQAKHAVEGQKSSQQSAAMAALAGSIAAGYARREKPPLIGGATMLSRPTRRQPVYGLPPAAAKPGLAPPGAVGAGTLLASWAPASEAAGGAGRFIHGAPGETGYECRPIGALYSPTRKPEVFLASLSTEPRNISSPGSVGTAAVRVGGGGAFISARPAETMDSDELTAEIAAIEAEIRRISERRAAA